MCLRACTRTGGNPGLNHPFRHAELFIFRTHLSLSKDARTGRSNIWEGQAANHSPFFDAIEDALIGGVRKMVGLAMEYAESR